MLELAIAIKHNGFVMNPMGGNGLAWEGFNCQTIIRL